MALWLSAAVGVALPPIPELTGPVVDDAGLLSPDEQAKLALLLRKLDQTGRAQMTILIVPSLEGQGIETYAVKVFEKWKLGKKRPTKAFCWSSRPRIGACASRSGMAWRAKSPTFSPSVCSRTRSRHFREQRYGTDCLSPSSRWAESWARTGRAPGSAPLAAPAGQQ